MYDIEIKIRQTVNIKALLAKVDALIEEVETLPNGILTPLQVDNLKVLRRYLEPRRCGAFNKHEDKVCDRVFIGRPNQRFCSAKCQNRAATQVFRMKKRA